MDVRVEYAFCTQQGEVTRMAFEYPDFAEMWASGLAKDIPGTLYMMDEGCWIPVMVFGMSDDDLSVVARGMAFLAAVDGRDYVGALKDYLSCEEMPDSVKRALLAEVGLRSRRRSAPSPFFSTEISEDVPSPKGG